MKILCLVLMLLPAFSDNTDKCAIAAKIHVVDETEFIIGIELTPIEHWHTYWVNPGEAGMALSIKWDDQRMKDAIQSIDYPVPERYMLGGIVTYGYGKSATILYTVKGDNLPKMIKGRANWLTCDDTTCLPFSSEFSLKRESPDDLAPQPGWYVRAQHALALEFPVKNAVYRSSVDDGTWVFEFPYDEKFDQFVGASVYPMNEAFSEPHGEEIIMQSAEGVMFCLLKGPKSTASTEVKLLLKPRLAVEKEKSNATTISFSKTERLMIPEDIDDHSTSHPSEESK